MIDSMLSSHDTLCLFFFQSFYFFSLCFNLAGFYCCVFTFTDPFFCCAPCPVNPIQYVFRFRYCIIHLQKFPLGYFCIFHVPPHHVRGCLYLLKHVEHPDNSCFNVLCLLIPSSLSILRPFLSINFLLFRSHNFLLFACLLIFDWMPIIVNLIMLLSIRFYYILHRVLDFLLPHI